MKNNTLNMPETDFLPHGAMVFWGDDKKPWWVVEWQPDNGDGAYWIVDAEGNNGSASESELNFHPSF